jgi:hypothetical protein
MSQDGPVDLTAELSSIEGARVDAVSANPDTGLIALSLYSGSKRTLGAGIGPAVAGVGWLPRLPRLRAGASHPLIAAIRAHIVGATVSRTNVDADGGMSLSVVGPSEGSASLTLVPGRRGEARVCAANGDLVLRWPPADPARSSAGGAARAPQAIPADLDAAGAALVEESDRLGAARAKAALARSVKARASATARRIEAVRGDLARLGDVDHLQKIGRLLLAQGSKLPRGASRATLTDWEAGGSIEIPLDPARPAKTQAEAFFAKARRYQRGEAIMRKRLAEAERALADLAGLAAAIDAAPATPDALDPLSARARSLGASSAGASPEPGRSARPEARLPYTTFRTAAGSPILVGRSAKDNDALTTKHARPHDLWLHAKGIHGAHVVVPLGRGASCPPDALVDAATLAVHFSDARGEAVCEVSYVERRYVRKPRKSAPGAVVHDREKVIAVRVEPSRLARLLASKEEPREK